MARRVWFGTFLGVLLAASSSAFAPAPVYREPPVPRVPDIYSSMQGAWEVEKSVAAFGRLGGIIRVTQTIRIKGTSWENDNNGAGGVSSRLKIVLDPKMKPASFDLVTPPSRGMPRNVVGQLLEEEPLMKGIVQIDKDTLTFCYVERHRKNADRPKRFIAGDRVIQDGITVRSMTLKRVK